MGLSEGTTYDVYLIATCPAANIMAETIQFPAFTTSDATLPVTLTTFSGRALAKANELSWATTEETGFDRFVVQRSVDGASWLDLGEVAGAVSRGEEQSEYGYRDEQPAAVSHYRLLIRDLDGSEAFSPVLVLERDESATLTAYPNPTTGELNLTLPLAEGERGSLVLYDLAGRELFRRAVRSDRYHTTLDVPAGVYLLRLETASSRWARRVVVR